MVTIVVVINIIISLILLYVAWQFWQLRRTLAQVADNLSTYARNTHNVLYGAPTGILLGKQSVANLRQGQPISLQIQRLRQVLSLANTVLRIWRRSFPKRIANRPKRTVTK